MCAHPVHLSLRNLAKMSQPYSSTRATQPLEPSQPQGLKCDIEALYTVGGFEGLHRQLARRILQQQYV
jgi:hypothetical protein